MTQYINKAAVIAEIERRKKCIRMAFSMQGILHGHDRAYASAQYDAFNSLLPFLSTLEVKEIGFDLGSPNGDIGTKTIWDESKIASVSEPSSNLKEAAKKAGQKHFPDENNIWERPNYEAMAAAYAFKEGAQWQKQQLMENAVEAVIHPYDGEIWVDKDLLSIYNDCQRVKLIIIKEE